jgi:hypothetical protein
MRKVILLALLLPLIGCSWAGTRVENLLDRRAEKKMEKAAEMAEARPVKLEAGLARDVTLFTGTVTGPCRGLEARLEGQEPPDHIAAQMRDKINAIYGSKNLSEAEVVAGELQDLLPEIERARTFGGVHGGCLLPVTVAGDPVDALGMILPRRVLCPIGPIEQSCKRLVVPSVVRFAGGIVGADRVYYVPSGPLGGG